jgi:hypothetical protein
MFSACSDYRTSAISFVSPQLGMGSPLPLSFMGDIAGLGTTIYLGSSFNTQYRKLLLANSRIIPGYVFTQGLCG